MLAVRIARRRMVAEQVVALELRASGDTKLPAFTAGSHIDVILPNGLVRQYSLLNSPAKTDSYEIAVLRDPKSRGGSICVHEQLHEGVELKISTPRNLFPLHPKENIVLMAGGIGITPLLSMAWQLHLEHRKFSLHYCTRSASAAAFHAELLNLPFAASVHCHLDDGNDAQKLDFNPILINTQHTDLYVCGPAGFIDYVKTRAQTAGWASNRLHSESFSPAANALGDSFNIRLARRGITVMVPPHQSALEALLSAGIEIPASCEQGICGTCCTALLSGEPDHRDAFLSTSEKSANDSFLPCVSRARCAELLLDL